MTGDEKQKVLEMRGQGLPFSQIADSFGLSVNTVKSFCRRNMSACDASEDMGNEENKGLCKQCGKKLEPKPKAKPKMFCDDHCRHEWWRSHRNLLKQKAVYRIACACCGASFESYGNRTRKYCSHACYIKGRFGKEDRRDR